MRALRSLIIWGAFLTLAVPAQAAELRPYEFNPLLSLRGNCSTPTVDPVADPGCPYAPPPVGPRAFERPGAMATDSYGNVYVFNNGTGADGDERIDVFDDEGKFLTEFESESVLVRSMAVDSKGNLYTYTDNGAMVVRYSPSKYEPEAGQIKYEDPPVTIGSGSPVSSRAGGVALDASNDRLFSMVHEVLTVYGSAEEGNTPLESVKLNNPWTYSVAVDAQRRRLFVSDCKKGNLECTIKVFSADAPYAQLAEIDGKTTPVGEFKSPNGYLSTAIDEETGDIFIHDGEAKKVYRFGSNFAYLSQLGHLLLHPFGKLAISNGENASGDAFNRHDLFVSTDETHRVLAFNPPAPVAPEVEVSVSALSESEATLHAKIAPGGSDTHYAVEYTTQAAYEAAAGFEGAQLLTEGTVGGGELSASVDIPLAGLSPGTAYRFRVPAENEIGEAEPLAEGMFATYRDAATTGACPNQSMRSGASAALPDCRAYELVTPPETTGRPPLGVGDVSSSTLQASPLGSAVSFRIEGGSLPGFTGVGSLEGDPYLATRSATGWSTELAGPTGSEVTLAEAGAISADQGYLFWSGRGEGPLMVPGPKGTLLRTSYLRYPDGHFELVGRGSLGTDPRAIGLFIAPGGSHVIFTTTTNESVVTDDWFALQLEPNAPPEKIDAIYDRTIDPQTGAEQTHVVSLLPGEVTPNQDATYIGASKDGEGIAFSISDNPLSLGTLYLRVGNEATYEIGEEIIFAGVSEGGERIFYLEEGNLKAFDASTQKVIDFTTTGDVTPVNVASGGTRAYFVSPSVLGEANPQGDLAQGGGQNLYLSEEGQITFVGTVTDDDVKVGKPAESRSGGLGLWASGPTQRALNPSRLNPDGTVALFESRANLTGENPGAVPQIYRYEPSAARLHCISCLATGAPPSGGAWLQSYRLSGSDPSPFNTSSFVPGIAADGRRVFFESSEALVSRDTNGVRDVYEWEEEGMGSCRQAGGCVYLISSGNSADGNYLYGHSADGSDVFIFTTDLLAGEDSSLTASIYDARINGGFSRSSPPAECLGEACQPAAKAAEVPSLGSSVLRGQGNVKDQAGKARCAKAAREGRRAGKARCAKAQKRKKRRKAGTHGRAGQ